MSITNILNFLILPFLSFAIEPFVCIQNAKNVVHIASRPSIECYSKEWKQRLPFGILMIVFYGIVMPFVFGVSLRKINESNFHNLKNRFGSLITNYKSHFLWWETMIYLKKVLIIIFPVLLNANVSLRILISILVLLLFVMVEEFVKPYKGFDKQLINLMYFKIIRLTYLILFRWNITLLLFLLFTILFDNPETTAEEVRFFVLVLALWFVAIGGTSILVIIIMPAHKKGNPFKLLLNFISRSWKSIF
jgi:hypothetical protein